MTDEFEKYNNTGIRELRKIVETMNCCRESFLDRFTTSQITQLYRVMKASEWNFRPDEWTTRQVDEALEGKIPNWDLKTEKPVYENLKTLEVCRG